ncbi:MAG: HAD family hydrolase [Cellulomonas sp.]
MTSAPSQAAVLTTFRPAHEFFVGIDSDGCAFDAMDLKHKECFTPSTIRYWGLQAVSTLARETAEFVNLYSVYRGQNRWIALVKVLELLADRPEVAERGVEVSRGRKIDEFIRSGYPLSNDGLMEFAALHPDPELNRALAWSAGVDAAIADMVTGVPPFAGVRESLQAMRGTVDLMVVSATPVAALDREWGEHGLTSLVDVIAGQEMGTKAQHLQFATSGRYAPDHVLLIGDAPGDRDAAASQGALFYPINPGHEAASWHRFRTEALPRFLDGSYAGSYQASLVTEFEALLPGTPPWQLPVPASAG